MTRIDIEGAVERAGREAEEALSGGYGIVNGGPRVGWRGGGGTAARRAAVRVARDARIVDAYGRGEKILAIAARFGLSVPGIQKVLKRAGVRRGRTVRREWGRILVAVRAYAAGKGTVAEILARWGIGMNALYDGLRSAGIPLRMKRGNGGPRVERAAGGSGSPEDRGSPGETEDRAGSAVADSAGGEVRA